MFVVFHLCTLSSPAGCCINWAPEKENPWFFCLLPSLSIGLNCKCAQLLELFHLKEERTCCLLFNFFELFCVICLILCRNIFKETHLLVFILRSLPFWSSCPSLYHRKEGLGFPVASHFRYSLSPSTRDCPFIGRSLGAEAGDTKKKKIPKVRKVPYVLKGSSGTELRCQGRAEGQSSPELVGKWRKINSIWQRLKVANGISIRGPFSRGV